jgi:hypothetical protein
MFQRKNQSIALIKTAGIADSTPRRSHMSSKENNTTYLYIPRPLLAPTALGTDPVDGLLQAADLQRPITVTFPIWREGVEGDYYQLKFDGNIVGLRKNLGPNPTVGEMLSLELFIDASWREGEHELGYFIQRFIGGSPSTSPTIPLIIDRIPPGGGTLAPLTFPAQAENGLTSLELTAMGNILVATVPRYVDVKWGDVIRSYWAGQAGPVHTVLAEQVAGPDISLSFDRTYLESLEDGEVAVTYTVTDRAGNISVTSQAASLVLRIKNTPTGKPTH